MHISRRAVSEPIYTYRRVRPVFWRDYLAVGIMIILGFHMLLQVLRGSGILNKVLRATRARYTGVLEGGTVSHIPNFYRRGVLVSVFVSCISCLVLLLHILIFLSSPSDEIIAEFTSMSAPAHELEPPFRGLRSCWPQLSWALNHTRQSR